MHAGVKHLVMLNHSGGGASGLTARGPREEADDREETPNRPRGRGGGQEGTGGRGKGYKWGQRRFWSAWKTTTIKHSSGSQCRLVLVLS